MKNKTINYLNKIDTKAILDVHKGFAEEIDKLPEATQVLVISLNPRVEYNGFGISAFSKKVRYSVTAVDTKEKNKHYIQIDNNTYLKAKGIKAVLKEIDTVALVSDNVSDTLRDSITEALTGYIGKPLTVAAYTQEPVTQEPIEKDGLTNTEVLSTVVMTNYAKGYIDSTLVQDCSEYNKAIMQLAEKIHKTYNNYYRHKRVLIVGIGDMAYTSYIASRLVNLWQPSVLDSMLINGNTDEVQVILQQTYDIAILIAPTDESNVLANITSKLQECDGVAILRYIWKENPEIQWEIEDSQTGASCRCLFDKKK